LREALKRLNDAVCDFESEGNSISGDMLTASMEAIVLMRCLAVPHSVTPAVANGDSSKQPCGHPRACIVSSDEGTGHCAWCEEVAAARAEGAAAERERLLELAKYLNKRVKVVKETARLGSIRVAGIREQWARELESIAATICASE